VTYSRDSVFLIPIDQATAHRAPSELNHCVPPSLLLSFFLSVFLLPDALAELNPIYLAILFVLRCWVLLYSRRKSLCDKLIDRPTYAGGGREENREKEREGRGREREGATVDGERIIIIGCSVNFVATRRAPRRCVQLT